MAWQLPEGGDVVEGRVGGMVDGPAVFGGNPEGVGTVSPPKACLTAFIRGYLRRQQKSFFGIRAVSIDSRTVVRVCCCFHIDYVL